jgi:glycosyltransferase 2 family protein
MRDLRPLIKLLISLFLIWMIFRSVNLDRVFKHLWMVRIELLVAALAVLTFQIVILAYRWSIVTGVLGHKLSAVPAIRITFIAQFFNQGLPSTVGGDAVRIWLAYRAGVSLRQSVHSVIADRVVATAMLLGFVLVGFPLQSAILGSSMARWIADLMAVGSLGVFVVCLAIAGPVCRQFGRFRLVREIAETTLAIRRIVFDRESSLPILLLSTLNHILTVVGMMLLALALGLPAVWTEFFVLVPFVLLLSMIPLSIGGWGLREGIMIAAFSYVGISAESALSLSLLFGMAITVVSLPGGVFWILQRQRAVSMRAASEEAHAAASAWAPTPASSSPSCKACMAVVDATDQRCVS